MERHLYYYTQHSQYETPTDLPSISYCENENEVHYYAPNLIHKVSSFQEFMECLNKEHDSTVVSPLDITFKVYLMEDTAISEMVVAKYNSDNTSKSFIPVLVEDFNSFLLYLYTPYSNDYRGNFEYNKLISLKISAENRYGSFIIISDNIMKELNLKATIDIRVTFE